MEQKGRTPDWPSPRVVYDRRYNIGFFGLERLHPFDGRKYGRAWRCVRRRFGRERARRFLVRPARPVSREELLRVHDEAYLDRLRRPGFVATVLEVPALRYVPGALIDWCVLRPMRWGTMGSVLAARLALEHGLAINLSGGYHHASPDDGHGFSAYADVGLAIHELRREGRLGEGDKVVYVDLDAHQGNGVCRTLFDDPRAFIYDQYNRHIFPLDIKAQRRIDCDVGVGDGCGEPVYLRELRSHLPRFLDSVLRGGDVKLAIYNAGTDVYEHDRLGRLNVSADGVLERDRFTLEELIGRRLPTAVLLSGGYGRESYRLVAGMVTFALQRWGAARAA